MAKKGVGTKTRISSRKRSVKVVDDSSGEGRDEVMGAGLAGGYGELPPGCPSMNPMQGDKTPAVVEWLREHAPDEFERRYKGRRVGLIGDGRLKIG